MRELTDAAKLINRYKAMEEVRRHVIDTCREITDYIVPRYGKYLSAGATGEQLKKTKYEKIVKNTAGRAHKVLKSGMQTGLTNPARPWFRLGYADPDLLEYGPVRDWTDYAQTVLRDIFYRSNFYSGTYSTYGELGAFGTACLFEEEDDQDIARFRVVTMGEYVFAVDAAERVVTWGRLFYMTPRQMIEKWPDTISERTRRLAEDVGSSEKERVKVLHMVYPRKDRDVFKLDASNKPWASVYLEWEDHQDEFLSMSGYDEFPAFIPVWESQATDEWGDSPGMELLADVKMLQQMEQAALRAIHKTVDPPMILPADLKGGFKMMPGSINFGDADRHTARPLLEINYDIASTEAKAQEVVRDIREGFYNDLFLMIANNEGRQPLTATEVLERKEEKMIMLGPVVERVVKRLLRPAVDRTFAIAMRRNLLPPPPPEIQGMEMDVEFIGVLAQAQKLIGTQAIQAVVNYGLSLAEIKPDIVDKFDLDQSVDEYADMVGSPASIIRSDDEVNELRQARAEEQQKMRQMADLGATLEAAEKASKINTEEGNALSDLTEVMAG